MKRINDAARVLTTMFKTRPSLINSDGMSVHLWTFVVACLVGFGFVCFFGGGLFFDELSSRCT